MNIRPATDSDWPLIEKLNELYNYENPPAFIHESIKDQRVLISEKGGHATGYLLWQEMWGNTPFLALVKILPEYQRNKHGSQLVAEFEKIMKARGFEYYISSSIEKNYEAEAFHEALSCKPAGSVKMSYGNEIFYSKKL